MKIVDKIKAKIIGNIFSNEELDSIMKMEKYYPSEIEDEDVEDSVLKYTNYRSQIWIKYIRDDVFFLVSAVTMKTKKAGKTKVHAFKNYEDIKKMMDYFRDNGQYDGFLIFIFGILLSRRIGDTLSLRWSDFYYENGNQKDILNTLTEQKTDKIIDITVSNIIWKYINWYCENTGVNPMEKLPEDIFITDYKEKAKKLPKFTKKEKEEYDEAYRKAISKQAAAFRYIFHKAADCNKIERVSTHSMRISFGYIAHEINKFDPDCLLTLQTIFGHSNIETTKRYIDIMDEKATKMFNDVSQYVWDIDHGVVPVMEKNIIIALRTTDFRKLLVEAGCKNMKKLNELLNKAEKLSL